jgi:hypothetical protein
VTQYVRKQSYVENVISMRENDALTHILIVENIFTTIVNNLCPFALTLRADVIIFKGSAGGAGMVRSPRGESGNNKRRGPLK